MEPLERTGPAAVFALEGALVGNSFPHSQISARECYRLLIISFPLSVFVPCYPDFLHTLDFPIRRFSNDSMRAKATQSSHSVFLWNFFPACLDFFPLFLL